VWVAKASGTALPAGKYKLGSQAVTVGTGCFQLEIHASSSIDATAITSFGSACPGAEFNNTMTLGTDWNDVNGTAGCTPTTESTWGKIKNLYK